MASSNTTLAAVCSNIIGNGGGSSSTSSPLTVEYNGRENGEGSVSSPIMNGANVATGSTNGQSYHQLSVTSKFDP